MNDIDLRERKCPVDLKKNFLEKKQHEILIFFKKKIRLFVFQKAESEIQKGFVPMRKKCIHLLEKNNTDNTLFFVFTLNQ